ncbi:hypothetical protein [Pseudonocardia thermophila]|uniref:hypothetical protein n=1 Tax=Pseudonocardia thermophila TaxID=1848 RepID=UPI00248E60A6|nr:hypothetical protein [Pseudonocardia thermophila]
MRIEAASTAAVGTAAVGTAQGAPAGVAEGAVDEAAPRVRRRGGRPRPVRPVVAVSVGRPPRQAWAAGRAEPVAVVVPLFGGRAGERLLDRAPAGSAPAAVEVPAPRRGPVRESGRGAVRAAMRAAGWDRPVGRRFALAPDAGRRFLAGVGLFVGAAATVVLLGLLASAAAEARSAGDGAAEVAVLVSPEGRAATR